MSKILLTGLVVVLLLFGIVGYTSTRRMSWGDLENFELASAQAGDLHEGSTLFIHPVSKTTWLKTSNDNPGVGHYTLSSEPGKTTIILDYLQPPSLFKRVANIFNLYSLDLSTLNYDAEISVPNLRNGDTLVLKEGASEARFTFHAQGTVLEPQLDQAQSWLPWQQASAVQTYAYEFDAIGSVLTGVRDRIVALDSAAGNFSPVSDSAIYQSLTYQTNVSAVSICSLVEKSFSMEELKRYKFSKVITQTKSSNGVVLSSQTQPLCQ